MTEPARRYEKALADLLVAVALMAPRGTDVNVAIGDELVAYKAAVEALDVSGVKGCDGNCSCEIWTRHDAAMALYATRSMIAQAQSERDQMRSVVKIIRGKHAMGIFTLPPADVERIDAALKEKA